MATAFPCSQANDEGLKCGAPRKLAADVQDAETKTLTTLRSQPEQESTQAMKLPPPSQTAKSTNGGLERRHFKGAGYCLAKGRRDPKHLNLSSRESWCLRGGGRVDPCNFHIQNPHYSACIYSLTPPLKHQ